MSKIYLCGQITGLSYEEARFGWRQDVFDALKDTDIECLSPMRDKGDLRSTRSLSALGAPDSVISCSNGITTRDRFDVHRSDVLFCNLLGVQQASLGSMVEFGWADAYRIPVLLCMEEGGLHEHVIVQGIVGWRCFTLEEGIGVIKRVLGSGL